jgi:transcriptional regulator with XRE-family HTH domain
MSEKSQTISKLIRNKKTREAYIRSKVSTNVASQVRALRRRQNNTTQEALAREAEMKQSRISAVERPGNRLNTDTLVRLAAALKVGLTIRFVSFSEMVNWENEVGQDTFDVTIIDRDVDFRREATPVAAEEPRHETAATSIERGQEEYSGALISANQKGSQMLEAGAGG